MYAVCHWIGEGGEIIISRRCASESEIDAFYDIYVGQGWHNVLTFKVCYF